MRRTYRMELCVCVSSESIGIDSTDLRLPATLVVCPLLLFYDR